MLRPFGWQAVVTVWQFAPIVTGAVVILAGFSETGGGTVAFTIGGTPVAGCGAVPLTWNGTVNVAQCTVDLAAGPYSVTAAYSGDEYTYPSTSAPQSLTVS